MRKLIIDTDTGVDDALALMMALDSHKRGELEILAVTAVNGNTKEHYVQRNICRVLGKNKNNTGPDTLGNLPKIHFLQHLVA